MELPRDARFHEEEARFDLKWCCDDCGLFDTRKGCAHGYPTERHLKATQDRSLVVFCKDFEVR